MTSQPLVRRSASDEGGSALNSLARQSEATAAQPAGPCGSHWLGVFFDGPQPDQDHEGEEVPVWIVYVGTEDADPIGTVYHVYNFARAQALAERIAKDRNLELIHEATTA